MVKVRDMKVEDSHRKEVLEERWNRRKGWSVV